MAIRNAAVDQPTRLAALQAMSRMAAQLREGAGAQAGAPHGELAPGSRVLNNYDNQGPPTLDAY